MMDFYMQRRRQSFLAKGIGNGSTERQFFEIEMFHASQKKCLIIKVNDEHSHSQFQYD